jgi:hypothetical protein
MKRPAVRPTTIIALRARREALRLARDVAYPELKVRPKPQDPLLQLVDGRRISSRTGRESPPYQTPDPLAWQPPPERPERPRGPSMSLSDWLILGVLVLFNVGVITFVLTLA